MKIDNFLFHIVLYNPEIPNNTGNIGRTCVGMNSDLHLIKPLGFEITDARVKRAGLDYWPDLSYNIHENYQAWLEQQKKIGGNVHYFSTKAKRPIHEAKFSIGDHFVFGPETKGLPEDIVFSNLEQAVKIPFLGPIRSFNVANAVSVALYEAYRQNVTQITTNNNNS